MENSNNEYIYEVEEPRRNNGTGIIIFLSVLALLLAIAGALLLRQTLKARFEAQNATLYAQEVIGERDLMKQQLDDLDARYAQLSLEHQELQRLFREERRRVNQLRLQLQGVGPMGEPDGVPLRQRIEDLEEKLSEYEHQIAMMQEEQETLSIENAQIRSNLAQTNIRNQELEIENEQLQEKVDLASQLAISNVEALPLRERRRADEVTNRARRTDKISICFNVNRNLVAPAGEYDFYIRIIDPLNNVLITSQENTMTFEGETIQYSLKRTVNFQNISKDVCVVWDQEEDFERGYYSVIIFCQGNEVGYKLFELE